MKIKCCNLYILEPYSLVLWFSQETCPNRILRYSSTLSWHLSNKVFKVEQLLIDWFIFQWLSWQILMVFFWLLSSAKVTRASKLAQKLQQLFYAWCPSWHKLTARPRHWQASVPEPVFLHDVNHIYCKTWSIIYVKPHNTNLSCQIWCLLEMFLSLYSTDLHFCLRFRQSVFFVSAEIQI